MKQFMENMAYIVTHVRTVQVEVSYDIYKLTLHTLKYKKVIRLDYVVLYVLRD